jgi:AraC-like DNA-binding protein
MATFNTIVIGNRSEKELSEVGARALLSAVGEGDFVAATRAVLLSYRCDRRLRITEAAQLANLSVRSLQRKLASSGVVFSQLVDQTRAELAVEMLKDRDVPLAEVSTALGYSTVSNFARAFQRWTEQSPTEYRRVL